MKENIHSLKRSFELSSQQVGDAIDPLEIAAVFEKEKLAYVLIGGHLMGFYTGIARATVDVDFIVGGKDFLRATKLIKRHYAQLAENDKVQHITYDSKASKTIDKERIDLVKDTFPLFKAIVNCFSITLTASGESIKVPTIEAAIALKFAACISPYRSGDDKPVDQSDLMKLIKASATKPNAKTLKELGDLIYPGGGKELIAVVDDVSEGRKTSL